MSPAIDVAQVELVLLTDGWHDVAEFRLGRLRWLRGVDGATWKEPGSIVVACPVTAILAVKWKAERRRETTTPRQERAGAPERRARGSLSD